MKTKNLCLLAVLYLLVGAACTPLKESKKKLTVLSWNVWHGGHSEHYPGKGCEGTIGILRKSGADVILMVETYGTAPQVADSLGYSYNLISDNLCIYSRYPITQKYTFSDSISTFNFGGVMIDVDGTPVRLFDTWLHYLPDMRLAPTDKTEEEILAWEKEGTRDEEIHKILAVLQPILAETDSIPVIMGGDFNTHSHLDWTEATRHLYNHGGAVVRWPVSVALEEAGFKDSFRQLNPDPAASPGVTWLTDADSLETECRMDRIDFIYYQGKTIRATASDCYDNSLGKIFTFKGEDFFYPSDHGFVLTEFELDSK
ncbi:MAG: endonuclease/exonuclease/phosphatase family protein [Phocaeicola sp.]|nr:endonuclease/exonuclease/phosphatase family protein [Phocaeicola sp.]MDE6180173.1 endonuclease/exonuclease/phosphatase family protein [Phocaeicola sp.]